MSERDAFGPTLRRIRMQHGISINHIAEATKVSVDLWMGLERNDFSRWPTGIYARAYIREYATQIGVDPDQTVDEFCRRFPQGDRRAERLVRDHAALIGHESEYTDDLMPGIEEDRRAAAADPGDRSGPPLAFTQVGRSVAAIADAAVVAIASGLLSALARIGLAQSLAACAVVYHAAALVALGCTPAMWAIDTYLTHQHPGMRRPRARFLWIPERTELTPTTGLPDPRSARLARLEGLGARVPRDQPGTTARARAVR
jgi:transcriptional regulator with XRE-family HTH domain